MTATEASAEMGGGARDSIGHRSWKRERRVAPRVAARLHAQLCCDDLPCGLRGVIRDVGPGGLCVETLSPFALSSLRSVQIALPGGTREIAARGLWQRANGANSGMLTGLCFEQPRRDHEEELRAYVHEAIMELSLFLQSSPDLTELRVDDAVNVACSTRMAEFANGALIYTQGTLGTRGDSLFVVQAGAVVLEARQRARSVHLQTVGPGGLFAGVALLTDQPHLESAVARGAVTLLEIDAYTLGYLEAANPSVARHLVQCLVRSRARQLESLIERISAI